MQILADRSYAIEDVLSIPGDGVSTFVFARGWLLEILEVTLGEYYFLRDGEKISPPGKRFGVFYPQLSLVRLGVNDVRCKVVGIGGTNLVPHFPTHPVIFHTDFRGAFSSHRDAISIIESAGDVTSIEVCSKPSLISIKAKRLIDENYLDFPSISRIADRLRISHAHLSRTFKRDLGLTPSDYLRKLRVADATSKLSTDEAIVDISHEVGYNDLSRFYKQFRKTTKTSPAACREILRK